MPPSTFRIEEHPPSVNEFKKNARKPAQPNWNLLSAGAKLPLLRCKHQDQTDQNRRPTVKLPELSEPCPNPHQGFASTGAVFSAGAFSTGLSSNIAAASFNNFPL